MEFRKVDFMGNTINDNLELDNEVVKTEEKVEEVNEKVESDNDKTESCAFFKTYVNFFDVVKNLTGMESRFLWLICATMDWYNRIYFSKAVKNKIITNLSVKEKTIRNLISSLCAKGILIRVEPKTYVVNKLFFSKQPEPHIKAMRKEKKREVSNAGNSSPKQSLK